MARIYRNSQNSTVKKKKLSNQKTDKGHEQRFHSAGYTDGKYAMKRWSASLTMRQRQSKTTMSYHYTPVRWVQFYKLVKTSHTGEAAENPDPSYTAVGMQMAQPL